MLSNAIKLKCNIEISTLQCIEFVSKRNNKMNVIFISSKFEICFKFHNSPIYLCMKININKELSNNCLKSFI